MFHGQRVVDETPLWEPDPMATACRYSDVPLLIGKRIGIDIDGLWMFNRLVSAIGLTGSSDCEERLLKKAREFSSPSCDNQPEPPPGQGSLLTENTTCVVGEQSSSRLKVDDEVASSSKTLSQSQQAQDNSPNSPRNYKRGYKTGAHESSNNDGVPREHSNGGKVVQREEGGSSQRPYPCVRIFKGEERRILIEVSNPFPESRQLLSCGPSTTAYVTQITLIKPSSFPQALEPSSKMAFEFSLKAQYLGRSSETFLFSFQGLEFVQTLHFEVLSKQTTDHELKPEENTVKLCGHVTASRVRESTTGVIIPGRRSFTPTPFAPIKLGTFDLPDNVLEALLPPSKLSLVETTERAVKELPVLANPLSYDTYADQMHALLFLEEVSQLKQVGEHQIDSVTFRKAGEFLAMTAPTIPFKCAAGDRVIACPTRQRRSDASSIKYEGIIHVVTKKELLLQFNVDFHQFPPDASYSVTLVASRLALRRLHQSVDLVAQYFGAEWLFPRHVEPKNPKIIIANESYREDVIERSSIGSEVSPKKLSKDFQNLEVGAGDYENGNSSYLNPRKLSPPSPSSSTSTHHDSSFGAEVESDRRFGQGSVRTKNKADNKIKWNGSLSGRGHRSLNNEQPVEIKERQIKDIRWYQRTLNLHQKAVVRNVLAGTTRPLPYVILGPPGTGKSSTVVETILQVDALIPESRILVATPTNSTADSIAIDILKHSRLSPREMVRMVGYYYLEKGPMDDGLLPFTATPVFKNPKPGGGISVESAALLNREQLSKRRIIISTLGAIGQLFNMGFPRGYFTHIIIDEAGQSTEPETMIPMAFLSTQSGQVVLAGDPLQLGATVISPIAGRLGLKKSFLARLLEHPPYAKQLSRFPSTSGYNPALITKLVLNYRSLPKLLELPNKMFYDNELIPTICEETSEAANVLRAIKGALPLPTGQSVLFHGIRGDNVQGNSSFSWYNPLEVEQVTLYVAALYGQGITPDQIGVITPYHLQADKIRLALKRGGIDVPKVGSVEEFQGQERMIVIVSVVRGNSEEIIPQLSKALAFVGDAKRLNVAISRSRAVLIIVGNPILLSLDCLWSRVLRFCLNSGCYVGCNLPQDFTESD